MLNERFLSSLCSLLVLVRASKPMSALQLSSDTFDLFARQSSLEEVLQLIACVH